MRYRVRLWADFPAICQLGYAYDRRAGVLHINLVLVNLRIERAPLPLRKGTR